MSVGGVLNVHDAATFAGVVSIADKTQATSPTAAASLQIAGGLAVALDEFVGGKLDVAGGVFTPKAVVSGTLSSDSMSVTNAVVAGIVQTSSVSASGAISADQLVATNAVVGGSLSTSGRLDAASVVASGPVQSVSLSVSSTISTASISVSGATHLNGSMNLGDAADDVISVAGTVQGATPFLFEGATSDDFETAFAIQDPTSDRTITFPDASVTVNAAGDLSGNTLAAGVTSSSLVTVGGLSAGSIVSGFGSINIASNALTAGAVTGESLTVSGATVLNGAVTVGDAATDTVTVTGVVQGASPLEFEGSSVNDFTTSFAITDPTTDRTITFPDASVTVNAASDLSGNTLAAGVTSSSLVTVGGLSTGSIVSGFGSINIASNALTAGAVTGESLTVSGATVLNGAVTVGDAATDTVSVVATLQGSNPLVFEGSTANDFETTFAVTDATADRTITFPDASVTVNAAGDLSGNTLASGVTSSSLVTVGGLSTGSIVSGFGSINIASNALTAGAVTGESLTVSGATVLNGAVTVGDAATDTVTVTGVVQGASPLVFEGNTADDFETTFAMTDATADRTITFPDASVTVNAAGDLSGSTLASGVTSSSLVTVGGLSTGSIVSGFGTINIASNALTAGAVTGESLTVSGATVLNGAVTVGDAATDTVTVTGVVQGANVLVFEGGTDDEFETTLAVADPTADRTITLPDASVTLNAAGDLTGNTLAAGVTSSSLVTVGGLSTGSIVSGFGTINIASNALTAGAVTGESLTVSGATVLNGAVTVGDAATDTVTVTGVVQGGSPLVFEGSTADDFETTFAMTDATADRTITFPDASVTVNAAGDLSGNTLAAGVTSSSLVTVGGLSTGSIVSGFGAINIASNALTAGAVTGESLTVSGATVLNGAVTVGDAATDTVTVTGVVQGGSPLVFEGSTANDFETTFAVTDATADRTITFPDASVTVNAAGDLSGNTLASGVTSSSLVTVGGLSTGSIVSGFGSINIASNALTAGAVTGESLTVSGATVLNGAVTVGDAATDTVTVTGVVQGASPLVFEGGTDDEFETTLAVADPTADRTITLPDASVTLNAAGDLTGNTLAAGVTSSSLVTVGGLSTGSIVSGFGTINIASNALTAGAVTGESLTVSGATVLNGAVTVGDAATDTVTVTGVVLGATPLVFEGSTANDFETTFAVTDATADRTVTFPDATITVNAASDLSGSTIAAGVTQSSLTQVGGLSVGSIVSGFGSISIGSNAFTAGAATLSSASVTGNIVFDGALSLNGGSLALNDAIAASDIAANAVTSSEIAASAVGLSQLNFASTPTEGHLVKVGSGNQLTSAATRRLLHEEPISGAFAHDDHECEPGAFHFALGESGEPLFCWNGELHRIVLEKLHP